MSYLNKIDVSGCVTIIVLIALYVVSYYVEPFRPEFFEGDPTISRPYHESTVGDAPLYIYSFGSPLVIVILSYLIIPRITKKIKLPV